eukprot:TRINITY_DN597_c6_g1_i1.p1 TRINITY_DN597_c6_g1~~TRINITY_DN597_c6_g1_i1.p1  ORF type:complete len:337 (+),score=33.14 TRINITY_DN597_c6_g1_i1:48-1013(+)
MRNRVVALILGACAIFLISDSYPEPVARPPEVRKPVVKPKTLGALMKDSNTAGSWSWREGGAYINQSLIVIGGNNHSVVDELVDLGYTVWTRNQDCQKIQPKLNEQVCREFFGYLGYLADGDPKKPRPPNVIFIHGHEYAWHQRHGWDVLQPSVKCAEKKDEFVPLVSMEWEVANASSYRAYIEGKPKYTLKRGKTNKSYIEMYNELFGKLRTIDVEYLQGWCCGQYVIPQSIIQRNPVEFYDQLLSKFLTGKGGFRGSLNGYFLEYTFHLFFGEPAWKSSLIQPACLTDEVQSEYSESARGFLDHSKVPDLEYGLVRSRV